MLTEKIYLLGHMIPLDMAVTIVGFTWTAAVGGLFLTEKGRSFLSSYKVAGLFFILLGITLLKVTAEISVVQQMAGGLKILDTRIGYTTDDVLNFAFNLGEKGREQYAAFQFGIDTWAPPAFACFVSSVAFTVLSRERAGNCLKLVFLYLTCAVLANALMPVIMLNYENTGVPLIALLLKAVPWLDFLKYLIHFTAWLYILASVAGTFAGRKKALKFEN
jgi:hypothetical protein